MGACRAFEGYLRIVKLRMKRMKVEVKWEHDVDLSQPLYIGRSALIRISISMVMHWPPRGRELALPRTELMPPTSHKRALSSRHLTLILSYQVPIYQSDTIQNSLRISNFENNIQQRRWHSHAIPWADPTAPNLARQICIQRGTNICVPRYIPFPLPSHFCISFCPRPFPSRFHF